MKGRPERVTFESRGFADVFWCDIVNEPMVLHWNEAGNACCPLCENDDPEGGQGAERAEPFAQFHWFICHVTRH